MRHAPLPRAAPTIPNPQAVFRSRNSKKKKRIHPYSLSKRGKATITFPRIYTYWFPNVDCAEQLEFNRRGARKRLKRATIRAGKQPEKIAKAMRWPARRSEKAFRGPHRLARPAGDLRHSIPASRNFRAAAGKPPGTGAAGCAGNAGRGLWRSTGRENISSTRRKNLAAQIFRHRFAEQIFRRRQRSPCPAIEQRSDFQNAWRLNILPGFCGRRKFLETPGNFNSAYHRKAPSRGA